MLSYDNRKLQEILTFPKKSTRELVKAYIHGIDSAAFDDMFELLAWN